MATMYDVAKAVYSGDIHAASAALDRVRRENWDVTRAYMAAQLPMPDRVAVDIDVQDRLDKLMAAAEREMFKRPAG